MQTALLGPFAFLERVGGRTRLFDKFVWNEFGQPKAGPEHA